MQSLLAVITNSFELVQQKFQLYYATDLLSSVTVLLQERKLKSRVALIH